MSIGIENIDTFRASVDAVDSIRQPATKTSSSIIAATSES